MAGANRLQIFIQRNKEIKIRKLDGLSQARIINSMQEEKVLQCVGEVYS